MNMTRFRHRLLIAIEILVVAGVIVYYHHHLEALFFPKAKALVGTTAPEIGPGTWIGGDPVSLKELRGRVVLLEFWTYGCAPCRRTIPTLEDWHRAYPDLVVIGIHAPETSEEANTANVRREIAALNIRYPVVTDNAFVTWSAYRVQLWPTMFVIDKHGTIRSMHAGSLGLGSLENEITSLMAEPL